MPGIPYLPPGAGAVRGGLPALRALAHWDGTLEEPLKKPSRASAREATAPSLPGSGGDLSVIEEAPR